jgi:O-antigen/teichoic acid export membrane protein
VPVVWRFGFIGAAVQYLLVSPFVTLRLGRRCRAIGFEPLRVRLDRPHVLLLVSFGLVSMASGVAQGLADTAVRRSLIEAAGAAANGLLQAPYSLAMMLKDVVLTSIGSVSLATLAPHTDRRQISATVDRLLGVVIPLGAAALGLLGLLGVPVLSLLFSPAFAASAVFFPGVLAADSLLVFVWVIGAPMLARGDRLLWLGLDLVHAGSRWALATLLIPRLGGQAVVVGYLAAVALHAALTLCVYRCRYGLDMPARHLRGLLGGVVLVALLALVGAHPRASLPATVVAGLAWIAYTVHHGRRSGIVAAIRQRLARV